MQAEAQVQILRINLSHIDSALRIMSPDILIEALPTRPMAKRAKRGENTRLVLAALHAAQGKAMSTKDLARAILLSKGKPALRIGREAYEAARAALRDLRKRGVVAPAGPNAEHGQTWVLARD